MPYFEVIYALNDHLSYLSNSLSANLHLAVVALLYRTCHAFFYTMFYINICQKNNNATVRRSRLKSFCCIHSRRCRRTHKHRRNWSQHDN